MNNIIRDIIPRKTILELFIKYPYREFTINEISHTSKTSYATTWRFVQKLDKAGIILTKTVGHSTVCKLNESSPFLKELERTLSKLTPQKAVIDDFVNKIKKVGGIKKVILFGSVARDQEKLTSDIDIAVIMKRKEERIENEVNNIVDHILQKSKMTIIPIFLTEREMKENKQFEEEVKKGKMLYERNK
jgi:predicted nucleotidyltransferase